jgi:hypothetical protein
MLCSISQLLQEIFSESSFYIGMF